MKQGRIKRANLEAWRNSLINTPINGCDKLREALAAIINPVKN